MVYKVCLMLVAAVLTIIVLVQDGPLDGGLSTSSGKDLKLFTESKERGSAKALTIITTIVVAAFLVMVVIGLYI